MSAGRLRAGLAQLRTPASIAAALDHAVALIRVAAAQGAELVLTPEATNILERDRETLLAKIATGEDEESVLCLAALAAELDIWLLAGSLMVSAGDGRAANRSYLFDNSGQVVATYDKIHLFDVELGAGESYAESRTVAPGDRAVVAMTPWGRLGLSVCYDLRFPQLYRALAQAGATLLAVPSAFTRPTGEAHWETLLRARAIETGAFVLAPAQGGRHEDGRATWGRAMAVDPWGCIIAKLDHDEPAALVFDLELGEAAAARAKIPSLQHDRGFAPP